MTASAATDVASSSTSSESRYPLRVGVILDSLFVPKWIENILSKLEHSPFAELTLIVTNQQVERPERDHRPEYVNPLLRWLYRLDQRLFEKRLPNENAFAPVHFTPRHKPPDIISTSSKTIGLCPEALKALAHARLDILLNFSGAESNSSMGSLARYGTWEFEPASDTLRCVFWRVHDGEATSANGFTITHEQSTTRVQHSYTAIDQFSIFRNLNSLYWRRSDVLLGSIAALSRTGPEQVANSSSGGHVRRNAPGTVDALRLGAKILARMVTERVVRSMMREHWFIAFRLRRGKLNTQYQLLSPPDGHFYADPFVITRGERSYIFFEDYSFAAGKAVISFVSVDPLGRCSQPEVAIRESYHLSYPQVFEFENAIYLLPETRANRRVQLYRATAFPTRWEPDRVLLEDVSAVDSTLVRHNGKFWLFTSGIGTSDPWFDGDSQLHLFHSNSLAGPWSSHPLNPVVKDIRHARCAGNLFYRNGQLFRPAQTTATVYGYAVCVNRVDALSESEYAETPIWTIGPRWIAGNRGTHTYNFTDDIEVLDGRILVPRFHAFWTRPWVHAGQLNSEYMVGASGEL